jgi:hypothetical protein
MRRRNEAEEESRDERRQEGRRAEVDIGRMAEGKSRCNGHDMASIAG